jgi:murein DD-endopeptidase MepM/ murein hydrolase activator NlpD
LLPLRAAAAIAGLLALAGIAGAVPPLETRWSGELLRYLDSLHLDADALDPESWVDELVDRSKAGASDQAVGEWMHEETARRIFAFAPRDAQPDPAQRYRLPFDEVVPCKLVEAASHRYAFAVPVGEPVLAAAAGEVRLVVDGFREVEDEGPYIGRGNRVVVLHADGTLGVYEHLAAGIRVRAGQTLKRKQTLGSVGPARPGLPPHLHFQVARLASDGLPEAVPIRFHSDAPEGFVPEPGAPLGKRPPPNSLLRVSVGGQVPGAKQAIALAAGATVQLQVTLQPRSGPARDVTRDLDTRYAVRTPWNLSASADGQVRGKPSEGYPPASEPTRIGVVTVVHRDPAHKLLAYSDVLFATDAAPAATPPR